VNGDAPFYRLSCGLPGGGRHVCPCFSWASVISTCGLCGDCETFVCHHCGVGPCSCLYRLSDFSTSYACYLYYLRQSLAKWPTLSQLRHLSSRFFFSGRFLETSKFFEFLPHSNISCVLTNVDRLTSVFLLVKGFQRVFSIVFVLVVHE
jgi:hypothetical protein